MSIDTVDLLHAAEDHIGVLETVLADVWEALQMPFDWSADTPATVAEIMTRAGYKQVDESIIRPIEDRYGRGRLSHAATDEEYAMIRRHFTPEPYCRTRYSRRRLRERVLRMSVPLTRGEGP